MAAVVKKHSISSELAQEMVAEASAAGAGNEPARAATSLRNSRRSPLLLK